MDRGYVKLWRKTLDSGLLTNGPALQLFTWLLLNATHKPRRVIYAGQVIDLEPGECLYGRKKVSEMLGLSEQQIKTAMIILKKLKIATSKPTNKYSIVSLYNWGTYQAEQPTGNQQNNQQTTSNQPASHQQPTTEQECKNISIKETRERGADAPARSQAKRFTPPTLDEVKAYCAGSKLQMDAERFFDHFTSNGWRVSGKAPMKDWKAAARNWARNERGSFKAKSPTPPPKAGQFDWDKQAQTMREVYEELMEDKEYGNTAGCGDTAQVGGSHGLGSQLRQGLSQAASQDLGAVIG